MSTSPVDLETEFKIKLWREKAANGTLTLEEMKEAIVCLRRGRQAAAEAASKSTATGGTGGGRKKKETPNAQSLLDGL